MTKEARAILAMYGPNTYAFTLNPSKPHIRELIDGGFIKWVPTTGWSGENTYGITEKGKAALEKP